MKYLKSIGILSALGLFTATTLAADVITAQPLSGNFALTLSGFELVTPSGGSPLHLDLKGEGLVIADGNGNLSGNATLTAADPTPPSSGAASAQCSGAITGTIAEPGDGTAQIALQFTPSTPVPTAPDATNACLPTAIALNCVEVFPDSFFPVPEAGATAQRKHHRHKPKGKGDGNGGGGNPPIACGPVPDGTGGGTGVPIAWPYFLPPGATTVKCVATSVTTSSNAASILGASLAVDFRETPPASIVVPTPVPCPTPDPLPPE